MSVLMRTPAYRVAGHHHIVGAERARLDRSAFSTTLLPGGRTATPPALSLESTSHISTVYRRSNQEPSGQCEVRVMQEGRVLRSGVPRSVVLNGCPSLQPCVPVRTEQSIELSVVGIPWARTVLAVTSTVVGD